MNEFKQQCIELRKQDFTLPEIMRKTGRSKTSVYFHIKDIPLSLGKRQEISENSKQRALRIAATRKGKALRPFRTFSRWNKKRVLLIGHLLFDGEINKARCVYSNRNVALVCRVEELMKEVYAYEPARYTDQMTRVRRIAYYNVALSSYLKKKSLELRSTITTMPISFQRELLRAFFDDEGCMSFHPDRNVRRVRGYQKDKGILRSIQELLQNYNIDATLQGENEIVIRGRKNLEIFQKEINFSKGVRINGNRSNSIWKKSLEKRVLLKKAIDSFQS